MQIVVLTNEALQAELLSGGQASVHWISQLEELSAYPSAGVFIDLLFDYTAERLAFIQAQSPGLVLVNAVEKINSGGAVVRFNGWPGLLAGPLVEAHGAEEVRAQCEDVFALFHKTVEWLPDSNGFVTARVVSMIINEAYRALDEGVSTEADIDTAMKLGTNYPYGPFEWARKIGRPAVHSLLQKMSVENSRYEPAKNLLG